VLSGFLREVGPDVVIEEGHGGNVTIACLGICPGDEGEEHDRKSLAMWSVLSNQLRSDRQKNPNKKIVGVVFGGSAIDLREAAEFCDALIIAWYPGEQGGRAIARAILGKTNPGGRLPITYCKDPDRLPDFEDYTLPGHSYRYMDSNVLFPFGFGLSYTTFAYSDIRMKKGAGGTVKVGAKVTNTGKVAGDEVVQLYVRSPKSSGDRRRHHLEGFKRIALKPGEKHVFVWAENATTGFSWQTVTNSATIAVSIEHKEPAPIGVPGCGVSGSARVTVAAREGFEGRARAVLKNMRPWNGETAETRVVKVELR
jgi:predicted secreted protein